MKRKSYNIQLTTLLKSHFKTTGIVLKRHPFKEADLMVTLITPDQGKVTGLAKGGRKLTSRLCGKLEPFYLVQLEAIAGQTFSYLKEADVLDHCPLYTMDLNAQNAIHFLAELTNRLTIEGQDIGAIFSLWQELMRVWAEHEAKTDVLLHAGVIKLLTELGFMASWQHCGNSQEKLDIHQPIYLNAEEVSLTHLPHPGSTAISSTLVKWVNFMQHFPLEDIVRVSPNAEEKEQVWGLLQKLIYPLLSQPMKSERFLMVS